MGLVFCRYLAYTHSGVFSVSVFSHLSGMFAMPVKSRHNLRYIVRHTSPKGDKLTAGEFTIRQNAEKLAGKIPGAYVEVKLYSPCVY